jgi:uncharacterized protein (TIGR00106 family)
MDCCGKVELTVVVELNVIPLGKGVAISKFLAPVIGELERSGVRYSITPMCTIFEAENVEEAFRLVVSAHESVFRSGVERVVTTVKVDDRRDVERSMEEKVESLRREV